MDFLDYVEEEKDEAKKEGAFENAIETAKKMINNGKLSNEEISECSGLPLEKIEALAKELTEKVEQ